MIQHPPFSGYGQYIRLSVAMGSGQQFMFPLLDAVLVCCGMLFACFWRTLLGDCVAARVPLPCSRCFLLCAIPGHCLRIC